MQHIENDMDDLFKKAGDHYPLNTSGSNWEAVRNSLSDETTAAVYGKKDKPWKGLWILVLFIPIAWMAYHHTNSPSSRPASSATTNPEKTSKRERKNEEDRGNLRAMNAEGDNKEHIPTGNAPNRVSGTVISGNTAPTIPVGNDQAPGPAASPVSVIEKNKGRKSVAGKTNEETNIQDNRAYYTLSRLSKPGRLDTGQEMELQAVGIKMLPATLHSPYSTGEVKINFIEDNPFIKNAVSTTDRKKLNPKNPAKIYLGLTAGPDLSWINAQQVKNIGFSVGLSLGYRINDHFAIELGALYDQKKYYTRGKYFDKASAGVPQNITIAWLDGGCTMFEFPLLVRYNFNIRKSSFFVSTGVTSYFMNKESYEYKAQNSGAWYEGYRTYKGSGNRLFSNMQWSLGYKQRISYNTIIKIEPYIKVPVKDIGIGKMPVTSSGVYLGILHDLK